jgi:3-phosphoshikimate 1-carboxyvinyltransferase
VTHVGINPTRTGILQVLAQCGVDVEVTPRRRELGEMIADLTVTGPERLSPFRIHGSLVPRLIDEIPVLAVLATQAQGTSVIQDARELRVKETDRIAVVSDALRRMGAQVETFDDGMAITGPTPLTGAPVDSAGDHRIGMTFTIAGLIAQGETEILHADHIATSYPDFVRHIRRIGGDINEA